MAIKCDMTLRQIIEKLGSKDYEKVYIRTHANIRDRDIDVYVGTCTFSGGLLIPLDDDTYDLDAKYERYDERRQEDGTYILTVWEMPVKKDYDKHNKESI